MGTRVLPEDLIYKDPNSGCWLWGGPFLKKTGYGTHGGHVKGTEYLVHRIAYSMEYGSIPPKHVVMHKCDTPACVNPNHLTIGTQQDNLDDMKRKGRGLRKLTIQQAMEAVSSPLNGEALGKKFGVHRSCINRLRRGETKSFEEWDGR